MAQLVKNLPAMQETWVLSLGWKDPLEKGKATHSSNSGLENSVDCIVHGVAKSQTTERLPLSLKQPGNYGTQIFKIYPKRINSYPLNSTFEHFFLLCSNFPLVFFQGHQDA